MSICPHCKEPMNKSSTYNEIKVNGKWYKRRFVSMGGESLQKECSKCGIMISPDNFHHYDCENEECPWCNRRIFECECEKTDLRNDNGDQLAIGK